MNFQKLKYDRNYQIDFMKSPMNMEFLTGKPIRHETFWFSIDYFIHMNDLMHLHSTLIVLIYGIMMLIFLAKTYQMIKIT